MGSSPIGLTNPLIVGSSPTQPTIMYQMARVADTMKESNESQSTSTN